MLKNSGALMICFLLSGIVMGQSEKIGFGFRAGASIATLDGPSEIGPNGEALEEYSMASGFHLGAAFIYRFTDLVGMKAELVYSQRGTKYNYDGPSYYILGRGSISEKTILGTRNQDLDVSNTFLDVPLLAYYKIGKFEISGGVNMGVLLSSNAGGGVDFYGISDLGTNVTPYPFTLGLNYNYKSDKAGEASAETIVVTVDGLPIQVPQTLMAYYDFPTKDKNLYNTIDFGLVGNLAFYINEGLFLSVRYMHGLGDVDQNTYDISLQDINDNGSYIYRTDKNESRAWQFSVGFQF